MGHKLEHETSGIGALMLIIGWIFALALVVFLLHYAFFATKEPDINHGLEGIVLTIYRGQDSHFRFEGEINNLPVDFLIDTGATTIALSENIANQAGLKKQGQMTALTASGKSRAYITKIKFLTLGPFKFKNVSAVIIPGMSDDCLLGMNILSKFEIKQTEDTLELNLQKR